MEILEDPGVLEDRPVLEIGGWTAAQTRGGQAQVFWRSEFLKASSRGVNVCGVHEGRDAGPSYSQAVVHLQKGRRAREAAMEAAWEGVTPGGRVVLVGGNDLGIKAAVKRWAKELKQDPIILANRNKGRAVLFERTVHRPSFDLESTRWVVSFEGIRTTLVGAPGAFSEGEVDPGSSLLLSVLEGDGGGEESVIDLGSGVGTLGLALAAARPGIRVRLFEGHGMSVAAARESSVLAGVSERSVSIWWDAREPIEGPPADLVVCNPPFHQGRDVDLTVPRSMLTAGAQALAAGGRMLVVANRTLPYESLLRDLGSCLTLREDPSFKVLEFRHRRG